MTEEVQAVDTDVEQTEVEQESAPVEEKAIDPDFIPEEEMTDKVKRRIGTLTFKYHEAERRAKELERKASEAKPAPVVTNDDKPRRTDFLDKDDPDEAYLEALADYKANQKWEQLEKDRAEQAKIKEYEQKKESFADRQARFAGEDPEYLDLFNERGKFIESNTVANFIIEEENGLMIHKYLLKNPDEAARIQQLPDDWKQSVELARLESRLTQKPIKPVSSAPDPVEPIEGGVSVEPKRKGSAFPT